MDNTFHYNENPISAIEQQNWISIKTPSLQGKGENIESPEMGHCYNTFTRKQIVM